MASKRKQTDVSKRDYAMIPVVALRILACLMDRGAYSRDAAVKVSTIARDLDLEANEIRFDVQQLIVPGFAVLELSSFDNNCRTMSVYIETDYGLIRDRARRLEDCASQLDGRAEHLRLAASAMAGACHPWNASAAPASSHHAG